jgi:hypothetical protein
VDDNALSAFSGTSLQHLNLRETKVKFSICTKCTVPIAHCLM